MTMHSSSPTSSWEPVLTSAELQGLEIIEVEVTERLQALRPTTREESEAEKGQVAPQPVWLSG